MSRCGVPGFLVDDGSHDGLLGCNRRLYEYLGDKQEDGGVWYGLVVWAGGLVVGTIRKTGNTSNFGTRHPAIISSTQYTHRRPE